MSRFQRDESDPLRRAYRRYLLRLKIWGVILLVLLATVCVVGVPHIQTTYRYRGPRAENGSAPAGQKVDAWYLSVTGWEHVRGGQYGHRGCPYILFIPLKDCLD